jgi:hypothetical protein
MSDPIRLAAVLPAFTLELRALVLVSSRPDLAPQVEDLRIVARCSCGEVSCSHFYTSTPPRGPYGPDHENVVLGPEQGMIVLDVVRNVIVAVEVLDRPDVRLLLDRELPISDRKP